MTGKTQEVYEFIVQYNKANSIAPSVREIADGIGLRSPASVQRYIEILTAEGMVRHAKGKIRTLVPNVRL